MFAINFALQIYKRDLTLFFLIYNDNVKHQI